MNMAPATIADLAGEDASSAAARAALEANLGLDQPLPVRYVLWLKELLTGDLGLSYRTGQPVLGMIAQRVGPSLILTGTGVAAAVVIGIPPGGDGRLEAPLPLEPAGRRADSAQLQRPGLFLCVLAIFFLFRGPGLASGGGDVLRRRRRRPGGPAAPLGAPGLGGLPEQPGQPGAPDRQRLRGSAGRGLHPHRPGQGSARVGGGLEAWLPHGTAAGGHHHPQPYPPYHRGGSLVVERIFGWPGMGSLLFTSVSSRDYTVIMGLTVVIALTVLATGILMDLVYRLVDPRRGMGR